MPNSPRNNSCCYAPFLYMNIRRIIRSFEKWRDAGESMVLATVYDTVGSTYTKAGHRIVIAANGDYQGLVSGGCLEGDLADRSGSVLASGRSEAVTYDMRDETDDLWGLGVGCNGLIRVFLQPLIAAENYQPFAGISERLLANRPAAVATVIESDNPRILAGATLIWEPSYTECWHVGEEIAEMMASQCEVAYDLGGAHYKTEENGLFVLYASVSAVPSLLVLGAGLDSVPVVNMAAELGWLVTVADHRPAYLEKGIFSQADQVMLIDPQALDVELDLSKFDAVIIMSHHLATDKTYLRKVSKIKATYLGVLGPEARRDRMLNELGNVGEKLKGRVRGPVGLDIGADSPESIALALLAEIQATLSGGTGGTLTNS